MVARNTKELIEEQTYIESVADRVGLETAEVNQLIKEYMRSKQDLPFEEWLVKVMRYSNKQYETIVAITEDEVIETSSALTDVSEERVKKEKKKREKITPDQKVSRWKDNVMLTMASEMRRLNSQQATNNQITNAIHANNGVLKKAERDSSTNTRTLIKAAVEDLRQIQYIRDDDVIGYRWISVLDGRTTQTCQDLSGREFYFARSGVKPRPPQHPNCRSSTAPITRSRGVPRYESFKTWASKEENQEELREALGATRYKLYTEGRLRIDRFTDVRFKALNLEELRKRNANAFERIED